ncbi:MAG: 30S ribosome-binding factor RbfA [Tissierellia bacterium]|nr:30S ribosome-binding factor RbfA [Tissierellia bacterium]
MNIKRINRISEEVKRKISELLTTGLKDPRINSMTSVTKVDITRDLGYANVYISVLGDEKAKEDTLKGLRNAKGFIRKEIADEIDLRYIPDLIFHLDESIEQGIYMSKLIEKVAEEDARKKGKTDG